MVVSEPEPRGVDVRLRPVTAEDLPLLEREATDPTVSAPFNWFAPRSAAGVRAAFTEHGFLSSDSGRFMVEVVAAGDGQDAGPAAGRHPVVVGTVSWRAVSYGPLAGTHAWDIGITLWPEHRGRGLGRRAQRLLADHLLSSTSANRIEASTDVENVAEQRALEAAGFAREGVLRGAQYRAGAWHDLILYARLRSD